EKAGYHQQVKVTPSSVLLFTTHEGSRKPIARRQVGDKTEFIIGGDTEVEKISQDELIARIKSSPEQFTPNALSPPVGQDYLFPTLAYSGGAAEAAYFAQAGAVYDAILGRITPIVPRFSATIIEPKMQRLLEKHGIAMTGVFGGPDALRSEIAARNLPEDLKKAFDAAKDSFDSNFSTLKNKLEKLDRTLVDAAETARSKIEHHLQKL